MAPYQVVEQAVVVHQEALSGTQNITQLALFNEDGTPFSGVTGPAGTGVPSGGSTSQVLTKTSATDFDTSWSTLSATAVSTVPATTGLDPASTDVEKALTELAARPSGGGGGGLVVAAGERVQGVVATSLLPYSSATNPTALVYGALRAEFHRALHTGQTISSLQIEVTSTSLSLGQVVLVGCFAEHEGFAGVKLWEQAIVCDDTTGNKSASGLELAMPDGPCWIAFGNPNSATVTLRAIPSEPIFVRLGSTAPAIPHMAEFSGFPADMSDWKVTPTTTSTPLKLLGTHLASRAPLIGALT